MESDFSDGEEAIARAVSDWVRNDTPKQVAALNAFLREGERHGWA